MAVSVGAVVWGSVAVGGGVALDDGGMAGRAVAGGGVADTDAEARLAGCEGIIVYESRCKPAM